MQETITKEQMDELLKKEKDLRIKLSQTLKVNLRRIPLNEIVSLVKQNKLEKKLITWAHVHNRNCDLLEQQGQAVFYVGSGSILLQVADKLIFNNDQLKKWYQETYGSIVKNPKTKEKRNSA